MADGVALVKEVLAEATTPPRWPMYLRQMKQFIRNARPDFDERRYGSLQDLLRACQKAGLVRLERDRQGGLRAFAGAVRPSYVPQGWVAPEGEVEIDVANEPTATDSGTDAVDAVVVTEGDAAQTAPARTDTGADESMPQRQPEDAARLHADGDDDEEAGAGPDTDESDDQLAMFGVVRPTDPEPMKARRPTAARRPRKAGATETARPRRAARKPPVRRGKKP